MRKRINTLFTSAGRRVELLRAFRRAYENLDLEGNIIVLDIDPIAPVHQVADRSYIVPRVTHPAYIETVVAICKKECVNLVFPLIDPDIPVLAKHKDVIRSTGAGVAVVSSQAVEITSDKWETQQFFKLLDLATPRSWLPAHVESGSMTFPLFIKPRRGSAGQDTYPVRNREELNFFLSYVPDPIVQEWLPGPEITCDVICDLKGNIFDVVCRERIEVRWGEASKAVTIHNEEIDKACRNIARALPAVGPITVQCLMKDGKPHFTEINARFGGGLPLGIAAGVDSPRWLLAQAVGIEVEPSIPGSYEGGLYLTRFDESFFISNHERERIETKEA